MKFFQGLFSPFLIFNIPKTYDPPETAYKLLNHCLTNFFSKTGSIFTMSEYFNVKTKQYVKAYYQFLTMRDTSIHHELLMDLCKSSLGFGRTQLEFKRGEDPKNQII